MLYIHRISRSHDLILHYELLLKHSKMITRLNERLLINFEFKNYNFDLWISESFLRHLSEYPEMSLCKSLICHVTVNKYMDASWHIKVL